MNKHKKNKFEKDRLNLGSSVFKKKTFINVDINKETSPDLVWDLNKIPYPFEDNSFSIITADHVLEHLKDVFSVMKELYRILKPGGVIIIKVPHFSRGFTHPDHKRGFDVSFPLYFNKDAKGFYYGVPFILEKMRLNWFAQPYLKKINLSRFQYYAGLFFGNIFNFFAQISPYLCSRIWCFWVGGFEEIKFIFKK